MMCRGRLAGSKRTSAPSVLPMGRSLMSRPTSEFVLDPTGRDIHAEAGAVAQAGARLRPGSATGMLIGDLTIRPFRPDDRAALLALNAYGLEAAGIAAADDYYRGEDFDNLENTYTAAAGGCMLVGEQDEKIVAMGGIRRVDESTCELLRMRVYPDYQGRGYGRTILELLEREASRLGYRCVTLVTGENQHPAIDLYVRHGYRTTLREVLAGMPSLHMSKDLSVADPEALRIQLQQAIEMIRSGMTLTTQSLGFFITADTLLTAYGFSQRNSGIILLAALTVIGMFVVLWRGAWIMYPAAYVAMCAERMLLPGQVTLVNAYMTLKMRPAYEKLDAVLGEGAKYQEGYWRRVIKLFLRSNILISIAIMFLFQVALFVLVLTVANYPFF
jgi:ribosomal protein S18 acetylase RimI-like enzyme